MESFTGFLLVLRNHGDLSHRGPLFILVIWIALAMLSGIWLRSAISADSWQNAAVLVVLHAIYLVSLILKGQSTYIQRRALDIDVSNKKKTNDDFQLSTVKLYRFIYFFLHLELNSGTSKSSWYALRSFLRRCSD